jgi:drug/metabolite transporter (DMT)-like permease
MLIPPSAVLMGAIILHERLALYHLVGLALIGLGLVVLDGRAVERLHRWREPSA